MGQSIFGSMIPGVPSYPGMQQRPVNNPVVNMQNFLQAMMNPPAYLKQKFPDIPDNIANDPGQIMQYLQQTRGINNGDIQQAQSNMQNAMQGAMPWQK